MKIIRKNKKKKLHLSKKKSKLKKFKIYIDTIGNKSYFVTLKTYTVDDLDMNFIKAIQNRTRYDKFIIEESNNGKHLIGYYCKLPKIDEIANILN